MPSQSDGGTESSPPLTQSSQQAGNGSRGGSRRQKQRSKKKSSKSIPPETRDPDLTRYYFEIPGTDWTLPQFREVVRHVLTHFASKHEGAEDYQTVAETCEFSLPEIVLPEVPTDPSPGAIDLYHYKRDDAEARDERKKGSVSRECCLHCCRSSAQPNSSKQLESTLTTPMRC